MGFFHWFRYAVIATLIVTASCRSGPDYQRPAAPVPTSYKETEGWKIAQPRDDAVRGNWWEVFEDPQLNMLADQVNISNQNVAVAEAQYRQARTLVRVARAAYFPTVTTGPSFTRSRRSANASFSSTGFSSQTSGTGIGSATASGSSSPISDYQLAGDASWQIDLWGKVRRNVESARGSAQASAGDLAGILLTAQAELAQDYFQLRTLDAQKQLLDKTVAEFQKFVDLTKNRYGTGVASRGDVLQAETQLRTTQAQAIDVGVQRAQMEHAIAMIIGKPASEFSIPSSPLTATPPPVPPGLPSELLERRPDIAAAERRVLAANAQIGVAEAAYFPALTLSASGGFESSQLSNWFTWPSRFWTLGPVTLQETIMDGGLRAAQTDQARAAYDQSVATYRQTVLTAFQEAEDNLAALRILESEAQAQNEAVKVANESVGFITNQYSQGLVSALNVITAQTTALTDEVTAVNIQGRRMTACVLLIEFLGGGWKTSELPSEKAVGCKDEKNPRPGFWGAVSDLIKK